MLQLTLPDLFIAFGQAKRSDEGDGVASDAVQHAVEFASLLEHREVGSAGLAPNGFVTIEADPPPEQRPSAVPDLSWSDDPAEQAALPHSEVAGPPQDLEIPRMEQEAFALLSGTTKGIASTITANSLESVGEDGQTRLSVQDIPAILPEQPLKSGPAWPVIDIAIGARRSVPREPPPAPPIMSANLIEQDATATPWVHKVALRGLALTAPYGDLQGKTDLGHPMTFTASGADEFGAFSAAKPLFAPAGGSSVVASGPADHDVLAEQDAMEETVARPTISSYSSKPEVTWQRSRFGPGTIQGTDLARLPVGGARFVAPLNGAASDVSGSSADHPRPDPESMRARPPALGTLPENTAGTGPTYPGVPSFPVGTTSDSRWQARPNPVPLATTDQSPGWARPPAAQVTVTRKDPALPGDGLGGPGSDSGIGQQRWERGEASDPHRKLPVHIEEPPIATALPSGPRASEADIRTNSYSPLTATIRIIAPPIAAKNAAAKTAAQDVSAGWRLDKVADLGLWAGSELAANLGLMQKGKPPKTAMEPVLIGDGRRFGPFGTSRAVGTPPASKVEHSESQSWQSWATRDPDSATGTETGTDRISGRPASLPTAEPNESVAPGSVKGSEIPIRAPENLASNPVSTTRARSFRLIEPGHVPPVRTSQSTHDGALEPDPMGTGNWPDMPRSAGERFAAIPANGASMIRAPDFRLIARRPAQAETAPLAAVSGKPALRAERQSGHAAGANPFAAQVTRSGMEQELWHLSADTAPTVATAPLIEAPAREPRHRPEQGSFRNARPTYNDMPTLNPHTRRNSASAGSEPATTTAEWTTPDAHPFEQEVPLGGSVAYLSLLTSGGSSSQVEPAVSMRHAFTEGSYDATSASLPDQGKDLPKKVVSTLVTSMRKAEQDEMVEVLLEPSELGRVRFEIATEGDRLQVMVSVERADTLDLLRRNIDLLREEFRQAGFDAASLGFGHWGNGSRSESGQQAATNEQAPDPEPATAASLPARPPGQNGSGLDLRM